MYLKDCSSLMTSEVFGRKQLDCIGLVYMMIRNVLFACYEAKRYISPCCPVKRELIEVYVIFVIVFNRNEEELDGIRI